MEKNLQNDLHYSKTRKRLEKILNFYWHLVICLSIIPALIYINLEFTPEHHWFWYSVVGGGVPLFIHALKVFVYNTNWEERKIQEILRKEDKKQI
jgi:hypothetical protein